MINFSHMFCTQFTHVPLSFSQFIFHFLFFSWILSFCLCVCVVVVPHYFSWFHIYVLCFKIGVETQ